MHWCAANGIEQFGFGDQRVVTKRELRSRAKLEAVALNELQCYPMRDRSEDRSSQSTRDLVLAVVINCRTSQVESDRCARACRYCDDGGVARWKDQMMECVRHKFDPKAMQRTDKFSGKVSKMPSGSACSRGLPTDPSPSYFFLIFLYFVTLLISIIIASTSATKDPTPPPVRQDLRFHPSPSSGQARL
ncbi:hypothetical protein PHSY_007168 [Pseudozyma hubeiensis SY62]|uniref:Uncharacterized protein n=1 Tax=Pseudozyma hubeiensis (strain SY62) TaxID=1305764 RepID=R9PDY3_PSEHS|nr:hypothetical protein PHSY_007168 [Pseudozyma hubeiensis SY62]GAC99566.1 hypothetical protein PHSY_007168 [Pseudozyma hubeiensis SY62]